MGKSKIGDDWNSDQFFDALDDFPFFDALDEFPFFDALDEFPFFDCTANVEPEEESVELSNISQLESGDDGADKEVITATNSSEPRFLNGLRRRSSSRSALRGISGEDSNYNSPVISEISEVCEGITPRESRDTILCALKDHEKVSERSDSPRLDRINGETQQNQEDSNITSASVDSPLDDLDDSSSSFLVFLAGLVIKAIVFQVSLSVSFFTTPIWLMYCSFMFVTDPYRTLKKAKERATEKLLRIWSGVCENVTPFISERLKGQKSIGKLVMSFVWGFFWSLYVCFMLFGFLVLGFVIGGVIMRYLVKEPIQMTETLNFDYTKSSPVALVPIMSCSRVSCGANCKEKIEVRQYAGSRVIPPKDKLLVTISLTLPESDYNRKLGVFQVRVDFLSANGKVTASSSYPCMLQFKSELIRYLETILKSVPLLAGYSSESQILNLKMKGFTERNESTSCIKVILGQRAEYRPGAGIPEVYAASIVLESELPLFKRILWYWKKTIFIWTSMVVFMMELMLILVCCSPIIIPRARARDGSTDRNAPENTTAQVNGS